MSPARSAVLILGAVMSVVYFGVGVFIFLYQDRFRALGTAAPALGGACIAYGLFRMYRVYREWQALRK